MQIGFVPLFVTRQKYENLCGKTGFKKGKEKKRKKKKRGRIKYIYMYIHKCKICYEQ
jgi:hypothetical protein